MAGSALCLHPLAPWNSPPGPQLCSRVERPSHCHGKAGDGQDPVLGGVTRIVPCKCPKPWRAPPQEAQGLRVLQQRMLAVSGAAHGELDKSSSGTCTLAGARTAVPWTPTRPRDAHGEEGRAPLQLGLGRGELSCPVLMLRYHLC